MVDKIENKDEAVETVILSAGTARVLATLFQETLNELSPEEQKILGPTAAELNNARVYTGDVRQTQSMLTNFGSADVDDIDGLLPALEAQEAKSGVEMSAGETPVEQLRSKVDNLKGLFAAVKEAPKSDARPLFENTMEAGNQVSVRPVVNNNPTPK